MKNPAPAGQLRTVQYQPRADDGGAAYLGEDVQLAHDVLQCAGQRLRRAGGLPQRALRRPRAPASAGWDGEIHFWLKAVKEREPSVLIARSRKLNEEEPLRRAKWKTTRKCEKMSSECW